MKISFKTPIYSESKTTYSYSELELCEGKLNVVLGPNGAGKTTLFHSLLGLERGTEFAFPDMSYNDVFVYGQTIQFPPDLRVREICSILINCDARQSLKATKVVSQYITVNKLENDAMRLLLERTWGKKFGQLSLGEQKLLFCHFMGHMNRKLFIIDEVTSGIDPGHRKTIIDSLQKNCQ